MLTPDQIDRCNALWRRLYERGAVRWMAGMALRVERTGESCGHLCANALRVHNAWQEDPDDPRLWDAIGACVPDWNAPTVLGCLLAMLREASDDPRASVVWYSAARQWVADWQGCEIEADNEPEALLLAIKEATNATDR